MRKLKLIPLLSVLVISLMVSLSLVQSVGARPMSMSRCRVRRFYFNAYMWFSHGGAPGWAESNIEWLQEWNVFPKSWWPEGDVHAEEYTIGRIYVCHGDWKMYSPQYEDTFRYRWWIFWESEEAARQPSAKSLGGYFIFSHGTGDFENMWAVGKAWVEMDPGKCYPEGWQYHVGLMFGAPN